MVKMSRFSYRQRQGRRCQAQKDSQQIRLPGLYRRKLERSPSDPFRKEKDRCRPFFLLLFLASIKSDKLGIHDVSQFQGNPLE
jgi:hypothetical protein